MGTQHVYPTTDVRPHNTDSEICWCRPSVTQMCPECSDSEDKMHCWKCRGEGWISKWTEEPDYPTIIVHYINGIKGGSRGSQ